MMKVLRAQPDTDRITSQTSRDFNWAEPGEILTFGSVCEGGGGSHAARCGCNRAFVGIDTAKATTFGIVDEIDADALAGIVSECKFVDGWSFGDNREEIVESVMDDLRMIADTLADVEVGAEARVRLTARSVRMSTSTRVQPVNA